MNRIFKTVGVVLILLISIPGIGAVKYIRQNELQIFVHDGGHQSENCGAPNNDVIKFYEGIEDISAPDTYPQADAWMGDLIRTAGSRFGCRNWYDPEGDSIIPIMLSGSPYGTADIDSNMFVVPDTAGIGIHKYFRYHPPEIIVDGEELHEPFPTNSDHYAPDKVWGTADVMVESHFRTKMGLDIYQRVLVWAQKNHNDYVIYDWTIVNTGNTDLDTVIERAGESIDSLYFMRQLQIMPNNEHWGKREWYHWTGVYPIWDDPEDSVRLVYAYPGLDFNWYQPTYDALGCFDFDRDYLDDVCSGSEVVLYVPQSSAAIMGPGSEAATGNPQNYPETDDSTQPRSHGIHGPDDLEFKNESGMTDPAEWQIVYNTMIYGEKGDPTYDPYVTYMTGTYPDTYHPLPMDRRGKERWMDLNEMGGLVWHAVCHYSSGPFDLPFGDSLRFVWATTGGTMPPQSCIDIGSAWKDSSITFVSEFSGMLDVNDIPLPAGSPDSIYLPPHYWHYPSRWQDYGYANDAANYLKDMWVYTTVDTVIRNAINAQWNFDCNYDIPVPPPPPSINIQSLNDTISVSWSYENPADIPSDLDGFKVYRATGNAGPIINVSREYLGEWELIYQCGPGESSYNDTDLTSGETYYYYVAAFDDTTSGEIGILGIDEALESGRWQNNTSGHSVSGINPQQLNDYKFRIYPNPAFKSNSIILNLPEAGYVKIIILDELGRKVKVLSNERLERGQHIIPWDCTNKQGESISSGNYFYHIYVDGKEITREKAILLK